MAYISAHTGELAALAVAIFWTITALAFEAASRKAGSLTVNIFRLVLAFFFIGIFTLFSRGHFLPVDATRHNWAWLALSGLAGLVLGDYFLLRSFTLIGSRFAMLIMTMSPPMAAVLGYFILGETLGLLQVAAMMIVLFGIGMAVFNRPVKGGRLSFKLSPMGIMFALIGALGQAVGIVLSKYGMAGYDPFASTHIRIIAGMAGYAFIISVLGRWPQTLRATGDVPAMKALVIGAFFGPFLGISFSLLSIKHTETGIASTIMALVPVFILAPAARLYKEKITLAEIAGAIISVAGTSLFFL